MQNIFDNDGDEFSMDDKVYLRLKEKEQIMLDAIDNQELEPVYKPKSLIFKDFLILQIFILEQLSFKAI